MSNQYATVMKRQTNKQTKSKYQIQYNNFSKRLEWLINIAEKMGKILASN